MPPRVIAEQPYLFSTPPYIYGKEGGMKEGPHV
jgi:hypothetical protein